MADPTYAAPTRQTPGQGYVQHRLMRGGTNVVALGSHASEAGSAANRARVREALKGSDAFRSTAMQGEPSRQPQPAHGTAGRTPREGGDHWSQTVVRAVSQPGQPLPEQVRAEFEDRFGADFSDVRVHTDELAGESARAVGARAYTAANHVVFDHGCFAPHTGPGSAVLAHELAHVLQQRAGVAREGGAPPTGVEGSGPTDSQERAADRHAAAALAPMWQQHAPSPSPVRRERPAGVPTDRPLVIQRWANLGSWSWDTPFGHNSYPLMVGSEAEWRARLANMDDEDEIHAWLQGFVEAALDPGWASATRHPHGWGNFANTVQRPPNDAEIMSFMRALYTAGEDLDLPGGGAFEAGGVTYATVMGQLSRLVNRYQGRLIQEMGARGEVMSSTNIRAVAAQTGPQVRLNMIVAAGAAAQKGVDLVTTANRLTGPARETAHAAAMETIRNAGRTIRHVLSEHDAQVAFQQQVVGQIFDTVWGTIPGGNTLVEAGKGILKFGLGEALKNAQDDSGPSDQAETINAEFVRTCNRLVHEGLIVSADAQDAINGFEAVRR